MKEIHILYTRESNHHPTHKMSKQKIRVHTHRASPHIENYHTIKDTASQHIENYHTSKLPHI